MRQGNENIFSMWDAVISFLDGKPDIWQSLKPFSNGVDKLKGFRKDASDAGERQEEDSEGDTKNKDRLSDKMIEAAMQIVINAHPYAIDKENYKLEVATDIYASTLRRKPDTQRADAVAAIITAVRPEIDEISKEYPVSGADLDALSELVKQFRKSVGEPAAQIAGHKTATKNADDVRREGQLLLKKALDKLVRNFNNSHPGFVSDYFNARVVRDAGRRGEGDA